MKSLNFPHNPRLDHVRFIAATLVFWFHIFHYYHQQWKPLSDQPWLGLITEGHTGVGLFFTLSGFLFMQIALNNDEIRYWRFISNRVLRIFPLFLTIFFISISIGRDTFKAEDILYIFFSNLGQAPTSNSFITGAAWTISIEFTFYLIFPFLGLFAKERGPGYLLKLLALLLIFKLAAYGISARSTHMFYSTLVGRFDQFLIGMLAALVYAKHLNTIRKHGNKLLIIAATLVFLNSGLQAHYASYFMTEPKQLFWVFWSMIESSGWGVFIVAWASANISLPRWVDRLMLRGGEISFSFYLLHGLVIYLAHRLIGPITISEYLFINLATTGLLLYLISWGLASLSFETIEKPFLDLRKRYGSLDPQKASLNPEKPAAFQPSTYPLWVSHVFWVSSAFLVSRLLYIGTSELITWPALQFFIPGLLSGSSGGADIITRFNHFDVNWYRDLATGGYNTEPFTNADHPVIGAANWAFFPVMPMLWRALANITPWGVDTAGFILANFASWGSAVMLYFWSSKMFGSQTGLRTALIWVFSAFGVYGFIPYTEPIFNFLFIGLVLAGLSGYWILSGILGATLSATRSVGVFTVIPLAYLAWQTFGTRLIDFRNREAAAARLAVFLVPLGLFLFMYFLNQITGDIWAFKNIQTAWSRSIGNPISVFIHGQGVIENISKACILFSLVLSFFALRNNMRWLGLFYFIITIIPLSTSLNSMPRYLFSIIIPYMILAKFITKYPRWFAPVLITNILLMPAMVALWIHAHGLAM